jgi:hypothetical protein
VTDAPPLGATVEAAPKRPAAGRAGAIVTIDRGTATCAAAVVGRVDRRWRLLASAAAPVAADPGELVAVLVDRVRDADPALAAAIPLRNEGLHLPRLESHATAAPLAVILAASEATRGRLEAAAAAAGWRTTGASAERDDPLTATRLATRPNVAAIVVGTGDPPDSDERDLVGELAALAVGVAARRPEVPVVLAGAAAAHAPAFPPDTEIVMVPRPHGDPGADLRTVLAGRRTRPGDARQSLAAVTGTLAAILGLRVELLEIGMSGALRVRAEPAARAGLPPRVSAAEAPGAALGLADDDADLDRIEGWTTLGLDRARLRDRLAELRLAPWVDLGGEGALLRAAALRAALERLVDATDSETGGPTPDLVILAGGAWSAVPAPAAMLVMADGLRRPGVVQVAIDPARLLAPLGTIDDPDERARLVADLLADALVPLGTLVMPRGVRGGRGAGHLRLESEGTPVDLDLAAGGLALVDLPPGQGGTAELTFRSPIDLGVRGRRFAVRATGGLAGLVVDLRDSPLRLPDRSDERRDLLARWERVLWRERDE